METTMPPLNRFAALGIAALVAFTASASGAVYQFDPTTPGLTFTGNPAFNATDGTYIYVAPDGSATAPGFSLPAGNYTVGALRTTEGSGGTAFNVELGGANVIRDYAVGDGSDQAFEYLGYYTSPGTPTVGINTGAPSAARLKSLTFTSTDAVYFDENSAGLSFAGGGTGFGNANVSPGLRDSLKNAAGNNIIGIASAGNGGSVLGAVTLSIGQTYEVFVSRQMSLNTENTSFDLTLGGIFFSMISGNTADPGASDGMQVNSFGNFVATSSSVSVLLDNAGASFGRLDYVQFIATVPEPGTMGLLMLGGMSIGLMRNRRKVA